MTTARYATSLTGGGAGALDAKAVATLADEDIAWVATGSVLYVYKFVAAATDAESSPNRIRPDDYTTAGVWYLQNVSADYSQMVRNDIDGGDITTSGQVITITPCSCWDSTRGTFLQTLVNKTVDVTGTGNNAEHYIFIVRLNNGTIDFKRYSSDAGAAADVGVNITHYRRVSWGKNNGGGVLMPYAQVGDRIDWTVGNNRPILTASTTASYVSYDISASIPYDLCKTIGIMSASAGSLQLFFSRDGSTDINTVALAWLEFGSCAAIYIKHLNTSAAVHFNSITLRR